MKRWKASENSQEFGPRLEFLKCQRMTSKRTPILGDEQDDIKKYQEEVLPTLFDVLVFRQATQTDPARWAWEGGAAWTLLWAEERYSKYS